MLNIVPDDCLNEISKNLNIYNKYRLYYSLSKKDLTIKYHNIIVSRIQFIYKCKKVIKDFKIEVCLFVKKCFTIPYFCTNKCLFYSPVVTNGICRICRKYEKDHLL